MTDQLILMFGAAFLTPMAANLVGTGLAVVGAAADLSTRSRSALMRLCIMGCAVAAGAMTWSAIIVWVSAHTKYFSGVPQLLLYALAVILSVAPTIFMIREIPGTTDQVDPALPEAVELPALLIAAILNAIFVVVALAR